MSRRPTRLVILASWAVLSIGICSCVTHGTWSLHSGELAPITTIDEPGKPVTVHGLAHDIDCLEDHIEKYGSVVAKTPDVWGQARLTKYRDEYEKLMAEDRNKFALGIHGRMAREDQAFFTYAASLSAAVSGPGAVRTYPPGTVVVNDKKEVTNISNTQLPVPEVSDPQAMISPAAAAADPSKPPEPHTFAAGRGGQVAIVGDAGIRTTSDGKVVTEISLEPTERLIQKSRYLDFLNQLRRNNEGDDTADSPGYSLNLVRIPVSVLPGKRTDTGFGAEMTVTMTPVLGDDLLPTTFRNLVVNDLVDQIGFPLTQILNDRELLNQFEPPADAKAIMGSPGSKPVATISGGTGIVPAGQKDATPKTAAYKPHTVVRINDDKSFDVFKNNLQNKSKSDQIGMAVSRVRIPATKNRRARFAFPPSQIFDIYGFDYAIRIGWEAYKSAMQESRHRGYAHLPEIQSFLQEELKAAYRFLAQPENHDLWKICGPKLAADVQSQRFDDVAATRELYHDMTLSKHCESPLTEALGWTIIVESALLNDQLIRDMKESATARGLTQVQTADLRYYLPDPPVEARHTFNEYVRLRWPIHVFALDPQIDEQNISDSFVRRRETQLALSVAFASGRIGARQMMRFARRLDSEYDTIALNRMAVGYSHGENTFGWRFYPRFQTPPTDGNIPVLFRDLLLGGPSREREMRQRKLEPGPRECVAIVMMPSFVPFVNCDVSANWFSLTNTKRKVLETTDAVRLSRAVQTLQTMSPSAGDATQYRPGELERLGRKAEQLSARLPLQTLHVQVPFENTLGGFEMFNNGITDLAPELTGWYVPPGIDLNNETTLFLYGDHFSVHQTTVIAGNRPATETKLLSRQVMQVKIPRGTLTRADGKVEVVVATPYGITQPLVVPQVATAPEATLSGYRFSPIESLTGTLTFDKDNKPKLALSTATNQDLTIVDINRQPNLIAPPTLQIRLEVLLENELGNLTQIGSVTPAAVSFVNRTAVVLIKPLETLLAELVKDKVAEGKNVSIRLRGVLSPAADFKDIINIDNAVRLTVTRPKPK